jgi:hypothetical protein
MKPAYMFRQQSVYEVFDVCQALGAQVFVVEGIYLRSQVDEVVDEQVEAD